MGGVQNGLEHVLLIGTVSFTPGSADNRTSLHFMPYRRRQLNAAALTANAVRPLGGRYASIPAFFAGWLASELAPQLLAATLVDTATELTVRRGRTGRPSRSGLALAAVTAGGLGYLIVNANRSATHIESTL